MPKNQFLSFHKEQEYLDKVKRLENHNTRLVQELSFSRAEVILLEKRLEEFKSA